MAHEPKVECEHPVEEVYGLYRRVTELEHQGREQARLLHELVKAFEALVAAVGRLSGTVPVVETLNPKVFD